ncbi:hypothetical protein ACFO4N_17955 [Camelliibacillus cellulosilyticus]|uniref:Uncharacterized protein n=1 Tax=Camelliibacillus cellulosilyticus TaxID=2174486 RepID=A0ABV9GRD7_9BACL
MSEKEREINGYKFVLEDGVINVYDDFQINRGSCPYYDNQDFNRRAYEIYFEKFSSTK